MSMDWDKLRIFKAVAEAGSFTHAGDHLRLSQSAVSRQISGLEKELGLPLFHRHARGLVLTEQGEMLLNTTSDVFDRLQQVQIQLTDSKMLAVGPLKVTTVAFIASTWLIPQITHFKEMYPGIQFTMLLDDRIYDLARREADVAIRMHKSQNRDLIERHMTTVKFSLCASKTYLEQRGSPKTADDLIDGGHTMIAYPQNTHTPFPQPNWAYHELGVDISSNPDVLLINSMHARHKAVQSGVAISILPQYLIQESTDIVELFPDIQIPHVDMYFVYPQERRNSERISVFRDYLFESLSKQ